MSQNLVIPNKDNKVVFVFGGIDLNIATNIQVKFGSESYQLADPEVTIIDSTTLSLDLSKTLEVGKLFATVTYFDGASVGGTDITSQELNAIDQIIVAIGTQLIIEDGTIIDDANSFASDDEFKSYSNLRGFAVPATQPERESLLILAMDYLRHKESEMAGYRISAEQELPYPRSGVTAKNFAVPSNSIPKDIKRAQMELALQASTDNLLTNASIQNVASETLGSLEVTYFNGGSWSSVQTGRADAYLNAYLKSGGGINLVRV